MNYINCFLKIGNLEILRDSIIICFVIHEMHAKTDTYFYHQNVKSTKPRNIDIIILQTYVIITCKHSKPYVNRKIDRFSQHCKLVFERIRRKLDLYSCRDSVSSVVYIGASRLHSRYTGFVC